MICSCNTWLCSLLPYRRDERRERHVPDVTSPISASVRYVDGAIFQVADDGQTDPEHRRMSDVQHVLLHSSRPLREG